MVKLAWLFCRLVGVIILRLPALGRAMTAFRRRNILLRGKAAAKETERLDRLRHPDRWRGK